MNIHSPSIKLIVLQDSYRQLLSILELQKREVLAKACSPRQTTLIFAVRLFHRNSKGFCQSNSGHLVQSCVPRQTRSLTLP